MKKILMTAGTVLLICGEASAAEKCRDWNWQKGSRKTAQFGVTADLCLAAQNAKAPVNEVKVSGEAEGYLFDTRVSLLRTEAGTRSNPSRNLELNAGVFVAGQKVWSPALSVTTPAYTKSFDIPAVDVEIPYTVQLGPIAVKVAAGVRGSAGVDLNASAELAKLQAHVSPRIDATGYAYTDVNLWIAHVGSEGSLLFARGDFDLGASSQVTLKQNAAVLSGSAQVAANLTTLDGRLDVYADTATAQRRSEHSWQRQLVGFDGYTLEGTMFEAAIPEVTIY